MTHLERLVEQGFLVEEDLKKAIEDLDENKFKQVLDFLKKEKPFMVSRELLNQILAREIEILSQFEVKDTFTVQDFVEGLNKRYDFLQKILLCKVELKNIVSINKISNGNVSVIGLVKDILEKNQNRVVILEDPTGYIETLVDSKLASKLALDDVVAVTGKVNNKILFVDKLFFPSIPLRPVKYSENSIKVAFLPEKKVDANYIIHKDKIEDRVKKKAYKISIPCIVKIGEVSILVISGPNPIETINKRYLNIDRVDFLIDPVPDIVFTDTEVNMSYKGISIVTKNKIIDLKTREVKDI